MNKHVFSMLFTVLMSVGSVSAFVSIKKVSIERSAATPGLVLVSRGVGTVSGGILGCALPATVLVLNARYNQPHVYVGLSINKTVAALPIFMGCAGYILGDYIGWKLYNAYQSVAKSKLKITLAETKK